MNPAAKARMTMETIKSPKDTSGLEIIEGMAGKKRRERSQVARQLRFLSLGRCHSTVVD